MFGTHIADTILCRRRSLPRDRRYGCKRYGSTNATLQGRGPSRYVPGTRVRNRLSIVCSSWGREMGARYIFLLLNCEVSVGSAQIGDARFGAAQRTFGVWLDLHLAHGGGQRIVDQQ